MVSEISYCRWSTDDFQCDLYVYEDVGGYWSINVAGRRLVWHEGFLPEPVNVSADPTGFFERMSEVMDLMRHDGEDCEAYHREDIDLPHAGAHFAEATPGDAADRLEELRDLGYRFPEQVITELRQEQGTLNGY